MPTRRRQFPGHPHREQFERHRRVRADIPVLSTSSSVVQEIWTNVPGISVTDIPTGRPADLTNVLGALQGPANYGGNYGERVRGYFTAPATGNYYFWITGSDSAQLWIADDNNQVNQVLRAWVTRARSYSN